MQRGMWDLSFPTRDRTHAPCSGSAESSPLDHQGSLLAHLDDTIHSAFYSIFVECQLCFWDKAMNRIPLGCFPPSAGEETV